jgi:hypothetical protein
MTSLKINHFYPLDHIEVLSKDFSGVVEDSIKEFIEFYEEIVIKLPENNYNRRNHNTPSWRRKVKCSSRDISKYLKNSWKPSVPKNDAEKIRGEIIANLNKLNEKKFTIITKEFIDSLEKAYYIETYDILTDELFKKIDCDRKYLKIYAKLVYELSVNKKWQKNMFNITTDEKNKDFFWTENNLSDLDEGKDGSDKQYYGPFDNKEDALKDAINQLSFEKKIVKTMELRFRNRQKFYFDYIEENRSNFDMYNFSKNRYLNFLEIIFYLFNMQFLQEGVMLNILLMLFNSFKENLHEESLEGFIHLYKLYKNNGSYSINKKNHEFFDKMVVELNENVKIPIRLKFFLGNIFSIDTGTLTEPVQPIQLASEQSKKVIDEDEVTIMENINCVIEEYPAHQCYEGCQDILVEIPDTYNDRLLDACLQKMIVAKETEREMWLGLLVLLLEKRERCRSELINVSVQLVENYSDIKIDYPIATTNLRMYLEYLQNNHSEFFEAMKSKELDSEVVEDLTDDFSELFSFLQA